MRTLKGALEIFFSKYLYWYQRADYFRLLWLFTRKWRYRVLYWLALPLAKIEDLTRFWRWYLYFYGAKLAHFLGLEDLADELFYRSYKEVFHHVIP